MNPVIVEPDRQAARVLGALDLIKSRWSLVIGVVLTLAMVAGLARGIAGAGLAGMRQALPANPLFYLAFVLLYLALPLGDFIIFRRLWHIPAGGLIALIKKRIANEVVIGYAGEVYFFAWASARARKPKAPFEAIKDVGILSAMAGNAMTLALVAGAVPFAQTLLRPGDASLLGWSVGIIIVTSLPFLLFAKRVFSLPRPQLWWIFMVHCARLIAGSVLIALAWHFALPAVPVGMWLLLAAGRMLVSRLPLVPNKDLLFANFAISLIGHGESLSAVVAVTAALTLLMHAALMAIFSLYSLVRNRV